MSTATERHYTRREIAEAWQLSVESVRRMFLHRPRRAQDRGAGAHEEAAEYRDGTRDVADLTRLFDACFRIQREACEAAGRHIPLVVENVKGAQPWVGRAKWHYGSFYLWGDVPALMPSALAPKTIGHVNKRDGHTHTRHLTNQRASDAVKQHGSGAAWFDKALDERRKGSERKAASAQIAKIPEALARHIARVYFPSTNGFGATTPPKSSAAVARSRGD